MRLKKKYNILLGIFIFTGLFLTTSYGKKIVYTINTLHEDTFTPYIKKINYSKLLNLKNINHSKEKLTKALTIEMVTEVCSKKQLSYMVINKNISVEYKFNNWNMKLIDDFVVDKSSCINWHKNNKTYTFINSIFELFEY